MFPARESSSPTGSRRRAILRGETARGATLLELVIATGIGIFIVGVVVTYNVRMNNRHVQEEAKTVAAADLRRLESVINKSSTRQISQEGPLRVEAHLTPCARPACPGLTVNTVMKTTLRLVTSCVAGPEPSAGRINAAVTPCLNPLTFPTGRCGAGKRPVVEFVESDTAGAVISSWQVPYRSQPGGGTRNQSGDMGASICVRDQGDHLVIDLDQVILESGGDGAPSVLKRSLVFPRSVVSGYEIK